MLLFYRMAIQRPRHPHLPPYQIMISNDMHLETDASTNERGGMWKYWWWYCNRVNQEQPDLVIDLGDQTSDWSGKENQDWERWFQGWDSITNIEKHLLPGNHEARNYSPEALAEKFGVTHRPKNGADKFSYVHRVNGDITLLMLSANYDEYDVQSNGYITESTFDWIEGVLPTIDTPILLFCSHYGMHRNPEGNMTQRLAGMVDNLLPPGTDVYHLFGHYHVTDTVDMGFIGRIRGYNMAAGVVPHYGFNTIEYSEPHMRIERHALETASLLVPQE